MLTKISKNDYMYLANTIFRLLLDGKWYSIENIINFSQESEFKTMLVLKFLVKFDFVEINTKRKKVKLRSQTIEFLEKT